MWQRKESLVTEYRSHRAAPKPPRKVFNLRNLTALGITMVVVSAAFLVGNAMAAGTTDSSTCVGTTLGPNGELDLHCVVPLPPGVTVTVPGPTVTVTVPVPTTTTVTVTPSPTSPPTTTTPPATTPPPTTPPPTTPPPGGCVAGAPFTPQCYWAKFVNGPPATNTYFPIGVWLQSPDAEGQAYKDAGINTFMGLYQFPQRSESAAWLAATKTLGMQAWGGGENGDVAAAKKALTLGNSSALTGYFLGDEQDMNKANPGDCCTSTVLLAQATALHNNDPTRPIYNNFGKAFARYPWIGYHCDSGSSCNELSELQRYCSAVDIPSADYYAATDPYEASNLHTPRMYGIAVDGIRTICGASKPAIGVIETGHPFTNSASWPGMSVNGYITPDAMEQGIWSMLAHGATGIMYFPHDFGGSTGDNYHGMLQHPAILARATAINAQIKSLAPWLNSARLTTGVALGAGVDATLHAGGFIVAAESTGTGGSRSFTVAGAAGHTVTVVGEGRTLVANGSGTFTDTFAGWGHHVYQIN
jgi:hypothetical protein